MPDVPGNERCCRQVAVRGATVQDDVAKTSSKPRNCGTGPKLFSKYMTRELLQQQFHIPMEEAGRTWGVSTTILKRVCRAFGIERWPYRQIQSARKRIYTLKEKLRLGKKTAAEQGKIEVSEPCGVLNEKYNTRKKNGAAPVARRRHRVAHTSSFSWVAVGRSFSFTSIYFLAGLPRLV